MMRALRTFVVILFLMAAPASGAQNTTPQSPACPEGWYPAVGAMSLDLGDVNWFKCSPIQSWWTVLGVSDDVVLIQESAPEGRKVIALDPVDGSEFWRRPTQMALMAPGPADIHGIVVLPIAQGDQPALIGVDAVTGKERWRIQSGELPILHTASATIIADPFGPTGTSPVRSINRETGEELWTSDILISDLSGSSVGRSSATALDEIAFLPTGETISAIDLRTGTLLWRAPYLSHVVAAEGVLVGTAGGDGPGAMVTALEIESGRELWTARGGASYGEFLAVGDGVAVVLSPNKSEFVPYELASGAERWRAGSELRVEPQLVSDASVVSLWEGAITVVSTTNGTTMWSATLPFGSPFMNSVGSNGEVVVVGINSRPWSD